MLKLSFEDQISRYIELYCWNYTCDELQEYEQGEVGANYLTILLIASDIVFSTLACLQGWTVGIIVFSMNGNCSMVRVLSRYYFWMSCLMSSLLTGLPLKSVALKNILGV